MTEFVRGLTYERFLAEYWRRKPLFVKGGAHDLLERTLSYEEADAIVARVREQAPDRLACDPGRIEFVKGADAVSPRLARRARELQRKLGWPRVTFDVSRTHAPGSIGCHFDYDDNFTLQQDGSKIWRIGSPAAVPETDRRRRVLEDPTISGQFYLTDEYEEFVVEAGDLLYIPLFHPHWGTSGGRSLSLTMTCNLVTPLTELWPVLHEELSGLRQWWHPSPLPAAPDEQALDELLGLLADPAIRRRVLERWQETRRTAIARHRPERAPARGEPVRVAPVTVDVTPIKPLFTRAAPAVDLAEAVLPGETTARLGDLVARRCLKRLLVLARDRAGTCGDARLAGSVQAVVDGLTRLPHPVLLAWCRGPEVTSWVRQAEREREAGYRRAPDTLLAHLTSFCLPELVRYEVLEPGVPLVAALSAPAELALPSAGRVIELPDAADETVTVEVHTLHAEVGGVRLPLTDLTGDTAGPRVTVLPALTAGGLCVLPAHSWYTAFHPAGRRFPHPPSGAHAEEFLETVGQALSLIEKVWPPAADDIRAWLSRLAPAPAPPGPETVPAFRGAAVIAGTDLLETARQLCRAAARTRYDAISDLYPLSEEPGAVVRPSSAETGLPVATLLRDTYAMVNEGEFLRRHDDVPDSAPDPSGRVRDSLDTLRREGRLTAQGRALWAGLSAQI
ncbi:cupin domain-containing protein [Streptomyces sp. NPDC013455]|uniref:JmjC domain-containing protein n=1 Tax=Streptomyces sp. NPDC013455 TaxID=3155605 RepID=UPI0033D9024B